MENGCSISEYLISYSKRSFLHTNIKSFTQQIKTNMFGFSIKYSFLWLELK